MSVSAWPQDRLDHWDRISRRLARVGGILLLAATLLPVPGLDSDGGLTWEWWFIERPEPNRVFFLQRSAYAPLTLLFMLLGIWSLRVATAQPLAVRGRRLAVPSIVLVLFAATFRGQLFLAKAPVTFGTEWTLLLLPPLGLALLRSGAARRLGCLLLALAGGISIALLVFPRDWSPDHLTWLTGMLRDREDPSGWIRIYFGSVVVSNGAFLALGLARVPNPRVERAAPWLWGVSVVLGALLPVLVSADGSSESMAGSTAILAATIVLHQAFDVGLYTVMGAGLFLWIALHRRPASDPSSWAA